MPGERTNSGDVMGDAGHNLFTQHCCPCPTLHFTSTFLLFPSSVDKTLSDDGGNRITGSRRVPRDCREICEVNVKTDRNVMVVNRITRRPALKLFDGNIVCLADYRPIVTLQIFVIVDFQLNVS